MSKRITKIQEAYHEKVIKKVKEQGYDLSDDEIWDTILNADHTQNNKNVRWIVETLLIDGFLWEDIEAGIDSKVYETIKLFDRLKHNIENINQRSLIQYKNLGNLYASIMPYIKKSKNELREEEKSRIYQTTEIFFEKDGLKILSPKIMESAQYWGRGTRWCTSAENHNMFARYNESGPLIIIITPEGKKFQAWKNMDPDRDDTIQFMNELDVSLSDTELEENWAYLKPVSYFLGDLSAFPEMEYSVEMKKELCTKNSDTLISLLQKYEDPDITIDFIMDIIKTNPKITNNIIESYDIYNHSKFYDSIMLELCLNPDFIKSAINLDLSNSNIISEIVENASNSTQRQRIENLLYKELITYPIHEVFKYLPKEAKTPEMSLLAFKHNHHNIAHIPQEHQTSEMMEILYNSCTPKELLMLSYSIKNMDLLEDKHFLKMMDNEIIDLKDARHFLASKRFEEILPTIINEDMADKITQLPFNIFDKLEDKYKTRSRCEINISNNSLFDRILLYVPKDILDQNLVETAIKSFGKYDKYSIYENHTLQLPRRYDTPENQHLLKIYQDTPSINYIVENLDKLDQDQCNFIIKKIPKLLIEIPEQFQTEELWRDVSNYNTSALKKLPEKYNTLEFIRSLDYTKENILLHVLKVHPDLPYEDIQNIIQANPKEVIHLSEDFPMAENEKIKHIIRAIDMNNETFFKLPEKYKTAEIFYQMDKDINLLDYIDNSEEYEWYNYITDDEKIELTRLSYDLNEAYTNMREALTAYPPIIREVKKDNNHDFSY